MLPVVGCMMGNVLALPLCGLLCKYGFDEGWPSIFYVLGEHSHCESIDVI